MHNKFRTGTNTLGIIFFCLTFGTVMGSMGRRAAPVVDFFKVIDEVGLLYILVLHHYKILKLELPL